MMHSAGEEIVEVVDGVDAKPQVKLFVRVASLWK